MRADVAIVGGGLAGLSCAQGVTGPRESRPLARLASARAGLDLLSVAQMEMSRVSTVATDIGGSSRSVAPP